MQFFGNTDTTTSTYNRILLANADSGPLDAAFKHFTFAAWLNTDASTQNKYIAGKMGGGGQRGWFLVRPLGTDSLTLDYFHAIAGNEREVVVPDMFADGAWTHVALTFDAVAGVIDVSKDGQIALHQTTDVLTSLNGANTSQFVVGYSGAYISSSEA
jgi:hypothetical protein